MRCLLSFRNGEEAKKNNHHSPEKDKALQRSGLFYWVTGNRAQVFRNAAPRFLTNEERIFQRTPAEL
jgi:hypothetical protein